MLTNNGTDAKNKAYNDDHYESAVEAFRSGIEVDPKDYRCWHGLGNSLSSLHRPKEAAAAFRSCLAVNPEITSAHCQLGNELAEMGDIAGGHAEYKVALDKEPTNFFQNSNYANFLRRCGRFNDAIVAFEKAQATTNNPKLRASCQPELEKAKRKDPSPAFPIGVSASRAGGPFKSRSIDGVR